MLSEEEKQRAEEQYRSLQFRDDFLFCKILTENPDIAKELLEMILQVKITKVIPQKQKAIEITAEGRGVRLDVYLDDAEGTVYDLEMQTTKKRDLPKRTRYYQGMIDLELISRGAGFDELKKTYVIFICTSDPFDEGRHMYSFENFCKEIPNKSLGDETYKIILNAVGTQNDVSENLLDFFRLVMTGKGNTPLSKRLEEEVQKARTHSEWRAEYMTLYMRDEEKKEEGRIEGRIEGRMEEREKALAEKRLEHIELARKLIVEHNFSRADILKLNITEAEYEEAEKSLLAQV